MAGLFSSPRKLERWELRMVAFCAWFVLISAIVVLILQVSLYADYGVGGLLQWSGTGVYILMALWLFIWYRSVATRAASAV